MWGHMVWMAFRYLRGAKHAVCDIPFNLIQIWFLWNHVFSANHPHQIQTKCFWHVQMSFKTICQINFRSVLRNLLTVAGRGRARWCCLCLSGGWRTQTGTSGWARSSAGVTGEGSLQTAGREHRVNNGDDSQKDDTAKTSRLRDTRCYR